MKSKSLLLLILTFFIHLGAMGQCAMCRASVENNVSNGDASIGAGLNNGILYLVVMPYLMVGIIGFFWYRVSKKKKSKLQTR